MKILKKIIIKNARAGELLCSLKLYSQTVNIKTNLGEEIVATELP